MTLTTRQAATFHNTAVVNFHAALHMAQIFATIPAIARSFQAEAADWKSIGQQIERDFPEMTPHTWHSEDDPEAPE